jgi:hypothetical protein
MSVTVRRMNTQDTEAVLAINEKITGRPHEAQYESRIIDALTRNPLGCLVAEAFAVATGKNEPERSPIAFHVFGETALEVFELGNRTMRADSVRPAFGFHLDNAQLDAHLDAHCIVCPQDLANGDFVWLVGPVTQSGL